MKLFVLFGTMLTALSLSLFAQSGTPPSGPATKSAAAPTITLEPGLYAYIYTSMGEIVCHLFDKEAPEAVANFRGLANGTKVWTDPRTGLKKRTPLYNRTIFHRVMKGFMIQGGDPAGDGTGNVGFTIPDEFSHTRMFDKPGVLAMARTSEPHSASSQFFITVAPAPHLNGQYTIFGEVVKGQDVADRIALVPVNDESKPLTPVTITRISVREVGTKPAAAPVRRPAVHHSASPPPKAH